jgi:hypothetical protein
VQGLGIKGSGSTSATTSLLVQNSAGTAALTVKDDLSAAFNVSSGVLTLQHSIISSSSRLEIAAYDSSTYGVIVQSRTSNNGATLPLSLWGSRVQMECGSAHISTNATGANASAMLDVTSTTKGFLPPRMTTTQRDAITSPATGLKIYNTTLGTTDTYDGATWQRFGQQTLIKGSGSTSATTSLLVQNSAGNTAMEVKDNLTVGMGGAYASGASGFGTTVLSLTATYPTFLLNSTGGSGSKVGFNMDTAKLYFSEETNGSSLFGHRIMVDTRIGGLVVKNDTAAGAIASLNASAVLQADSTTKGFLPPRMTTTQKNAISSPAAGLVVYDNTTNKLNYNNGTVWKEVTPDGYTGMVTVNATPPVTFDIQNGIIVNVI